MDAREASQLVLEWREQRLVVSGDSDFELGSSTTTELAVDSQFTSRRHAFVGRRNQYYVLIDHSTNGTYVQTEDELITFLRRGEMRLWGSGWLSLGQPLNSQCAIRFEHT